MNERQPVPQELGTSRKLMETGTLYIRRFNTDGSFETSLVPRLDEDVDFNSNSFNEINEPIDNRPFVCVFTVEDKLFQVTKVGGFGWGRGIGSIAEVMDGPEQGQEYVVNLQSDIVLRGKHRKP